ncbi:hypothetical protein CJ030_MR3G018687 [Morella rubra]|uniref:Sieve element occlusion C-terminal domain-containing protein n=1 Tax=Morella rubra TaxID=262757 RepID=A0A6A1W5V0_9ROSI|nr:hypothetical protein CJ030_MR3G018687 [Morella rubra]
MRMWKKRHPKPVSVHRCAPESSILRGSKPQMLPPNSSMGNEAFCSLMKLKALSNRDDVLGSMLDDLHPNLPTMIKQDKYIFFYGGKDNEWIQQFAKKERTTKGRTTLASWDVWNKMESFFFSKSQKKTELDGVTKEIQKLLSYKNESGWAVLSKRSRVVFTGHGTTILRVVDEFEKWKGYVSELGFDVFQTVTTRFLRGIAPAAALISRWCWNPEHVLPPLSSGHGDLH